MALSSDKNRMVDQVNGVLRSIGETIAKMPRNTSKNANKAPIAWEYLWSSHIYSMARARKERAERDAIKNGVIFDKAKSTREASSMAEEVYDDGIVRITVKVKTPSSRLDPDLFVAHLRKAGVSMAKIQAAREASTVLNRPAHEFSATLITGEGNGK